jgi:hypothetical protein
MYTTIQRTIHSTITRCKLNLPFSERRLVLFVGDITMGAAATAIAFWINAMFV